MSATNRVFANDRVLLVGQLDAELVEREGLVDGDAFIEGAGLIDAELADTPDDGGPPAVLDDPPQPPTSSAHRRTGTISKLRRMT